MRSEQKTTYCCVTSGCEGTPLYTAIPSSQTREQTTRMTLHALSLLGMLQVSSGSWSLAPGCLCGMLGSDLPHVSPTWLLPPSHYIRFPRNTESHQYHACQQVAPVECSVPGDQNPDPPVPPGPPGVRPAFSSGCPPLLS